MRPYRLQFAAAVAQVFLIVAAELLKPWPIKIVIDNVLGGQDLEWRFASNMSDTGLLAACCFALVAIYLFLGINNVLSNHLTVRIGQGMVKDLRRRLYDHIQRLSLAFHSRREVGDLIHRITADTYSIQTLTMNGIFPILTSVVLLIGMSVIMLQLDWMLTLMALAVCPILFAAISAMSSRINKAATDVRERESAIYSLVQRSMSAIRVVQAFTREAEENHRFVKASGASLSASLRLYDLQSVYTGVVNITIALGTAAVVWIGARHVMDGSLSVGDLLIFTAYLASLYGPINTISQTLGLIEGSKAGLVRVQEILSVENDLPDGKRKIEHGAISGEITFERITFGYEAGSPVLDELSVKILPGQTAAIVGESGAGKSTLMALLPRFYDPQAGRILIDGTDVKEFTLESLRQQIAMVLQPPVVFPLSIRDNIAYGRIEAPFPDVQRAADLARIHDRILELPDGYDTVVGENGLTLSEGEQQRLTIARAILRDSPILIMDEPTSSIDVGTEAMIMQGFDELRKNRTTFMIAHRLSTVRKADVILVMRHGRIVEKGSFDELMERREIFASLYEMQYSGQIRRSEQGGSVTAERRVEL